MNTSYMRQLWTDPDFIRRIGQTPTSREAAAPAAAAVDQTSAADGDQAGVSSQITVTNRPQPSVPRSPLVLDSIAIDPAKPKLVVGGLVQFTAIVKYSDGSQSRLKVVWTVSSDAPEDIVIDQNGRFYARAGEGSEVTITATATAGNKTLTQSIKAKVTRGDEPERASDPSEWTPAKLSIDASRLLRPFLQQISKTLQPALDAQKAVEEAAASAKIDLANPHGAAPAMNNSADPLNDEQKNAIEKALDTVQTRQEAMIHLQHEMQSTNEQIMAKQGTVQALARQVMPDADLDQDATNVGTWIEEIGDAVNVLMAVFIVPKHLAGLLLHAIPGNDLVKDQVKKLDKASQEFDVMSKKYNDLIGVLEREKKLELKNLFSQRERDADDLSHAIKLYIEAINKLMKVFSGIVEKADSAGGADSPGDHSKDFAKTYAAVILAAQVSQNTRRQLIGKNLEETLSLGTPMLGALIVNSPPDLLVYERSGKQYVYREPMTAIQDLTKEAQQLLAKVYEFGEKIDGYLDKWKEEMEQ